MPAGKIEILFDSCGVATMYEFRVYLIRVGTPNDLALEGSHHWKRKKKNQDIIDIH